MPTIAEFRAWGLSERGWAPKTVLDYGNWVAAASRFLEEQGRELATATTDDLKAYVASRPAAAHTRNNVRSALVGYFDFVRSLGLREDNPATDLPRVRVRRRLPHPVTASRVPGLIDAATAAGPMLEAMVVLYLHTGVRVSEGRLMRWPQVDGEWIRLIGKGGYERVVFLHEEVVAALGRWRLVCPPGPWIFPSLVLPGEPVSYSWVYRHLKQLGVKAGIEACRPHRLRATFGTRLYEQTHDLLVVQQALGHQSPQNTYLYTLVEPAGVRRAVGQLSFEEPTAPRAPGG